MSTESLPPVPPSPEPLSPESAAASPVHPAPAGIAPAPVSHQGGNSWLKLAIFIVVGLAFVMSLLGWQRSERVGKNAARKLQETETRAATLASQLQTTNDNMRELQGRFAVLEGRLTETAGQQAQLERMYRSISQAGLDGVLSDIEHALSIASQQLLVGGNVSGALLVLQDAEARLKSTDGASLSSLRRLLLRDIDRLKALPSTDVVSVLLRLDNVLQAVDTLPLLASFSPGALPAAPGVARGTAKEGEATGRTPGSAASPVSSWSWLGESSLRTLESLRSELQSLVRVNRVDMPEAVLLAPEQSYFVRENLRLQLLNARAALLARQDSVFRGDIERSQKWITAYFDTRQISVSNAATQLRQLQSSRVSVELPSLAETLSAVRALRTGRAP
jgi:uncharacterized protein HemX